MGRPGGGPDRDALRSLLVDEKLTHQQIAERYGVTRQAVSYWIQSKLPDMSGRSHNIYPEVRPWGAIASGDEQDSIYRALIFWAKQRRGEDISAAGQRELARLLEFLEEENVVVDYSRDQGWMFRRRNPDIDAPDDIVRRQPGLAEA